MHAPLPFALRALGLALVVVLTGCGAITSPELPTPETFSVDPAFGDEQSTIIRDAFGAWCASEVAYCPRETRWSGSATPGAVVQVPPGEYPSERADNELALNDPASRTILVCAEWLEIRGDGGSVADLWHIVAHEVGHYHINQHPVPDGTLMAARLDVALFEIDAPAVEAWQAGVP